MNYFRLFKQKGAYLRYPGGYNQQQFFTIVFHSNEQNALKITLFLRESMRFKRKYP